MRKLLEQAFFERDTITVARDLLGKYLVRRFGRDEHAYCITEVEAYDGPKDRASHAAKGKTPRTAVMFGEAGVFYVYLCYGVYWMLNVVTGPVDYPAAILIRGIQGASGPGKLTRTLDIDKQFDGQKAVKENGLWFEDRGVIIPAQKLRRTPRVGVAYAGPVWANKKYRFVLKAPPKPQKLPSPKSRR